MEWEHRNRLKHTYQKPAVIVQALWLCGYDKCCRPQREWLYPPACSMGLTETIQRLQMPGSLAQLLSAWEGAAGGGPAEAGRQEAEVEAGGTGPAAGRKPGAEARKREGSGPVQPGEVRGEVRTSRPGLGGHSRTVLSRTRGHGLASSQGQNPRTVPVRTRRFSGHGMTGGQGASKQFSQDQEHQNMASASQNQRGLERGKQQKARGSLPRNPARKDLANHGSSSSIFQSVQDEAAPAENQSGGSA